MASVCISNSVNDTRHPVRQTYVNLNRWPESDAEFVKMVVSSNKRRGSNSPTRVVDSISCRQMYLRSYTFSRKKEGVTEKTIKCLSRFKQKMVCVRNIRSIPKPWNQLLMPRRAKDESCAGFFSIFHRMLSCSSTVDAADSGPD